LQAKSFHSFYNYTRAVISDAGNGITQLHYYPFGGTMPGLSKNYAVSNLNDFQYNGKEKLHLNNENNLFWYDYGARMYDPSLGRWHVQDPLIQFASRYSAMGNNPIRFIDPDGMAVTETANGYTITGDDIYVYFSNLQFASQQGNWGNFYKALYFAANNPNGNAFANAIDGVNVTPNGNNLNYNREWGGNSTHNNNARAELREQKRQEEYDAWMSDFYKGREELGKGTLKLMGVFLSPILIAEAPAVISLKYAGFKLGTSAISQKIVNGKIDYADLIADGFLTPGAGSLAKLFNVTYDAKHGFVINTPQSVQQALLISGSSYLFGTANGSLGKLGTKHLGNNAAANGIYQGVVSFQTNTLENISTNLGD
jgi:RHS repeat-associated protein